MRNILQIREIVLSEFIEFVDLYALLLYLSNRYLKEKDIFQRSVLEIFSKSSGKYYLIYKNIRELRNILLEDEVNEELISKVIYRRKKSYERIVKIFSNILSHFLGKRLGF